jgi:hypothetical protein
MKVWQYAIFSFSSKAQMFPAFEDLPQVRHIQMIVDFLVICYPLKNYF